MPAAPTPTQRYAEAVLERTGFLKIIPALAREIEDECSGVYSRIDEEPEGSPYPTYGGVVYHTHSLIIDGELDYHLEKNLSDSEKKLFLRMVEDNQLNISIERNDWHQEWQFYLRPEIQINTNERLEIDVVIYISLVTMKPIRITATSENTDVNYDELLFLLTLSS